MHSDVDSAVLLIFLAAGLSNLLIIPFSLQLQPSKLRQAILAVFNGGKCVETSNSINQNVYTLGESDLGIACFEAFKTIFVDFGCFCLAILAIDRFLALRNSGKYQEERGVKRYWYLRVLMPIFLFLMLTSFLGYFYAAHFASADPTLQATGKIYTAFQAFRLFYLLIILIIILLFFFILLRKVFVRWNDPNAVGYCQSTVLTFISILINLPTLGYLIAWCVVQNGIAIALFLQTAFELKTPWVNQLWAINDQLVIWQSVAYFKIVNLVFLVYMCFSKAYRNAFVRVFRKSTTITAERVTHVPHSDHDHQNMNISEKA